MAAILTECNYGSDAFGPTAYGVSSEGGEGGECGGAARREMKRTAPEGSEGNKSPGKARKGRKGGSLFKWGSQDDGVAKTEKNLRGKRSHSSSTEVLDEQQNEEPLTESAIKSSPTADAKHCSSSDMKKVQRLNRELSKQNTQLLKSVDALKRDRESLLAEKQKLKSDNKQLEKELKRCSPVKKGGSQKHSSSKLNTFEASFEEMESLTERIEKLEGQLTAKDEEISSLQKRLELQSDLPKVDGLEKKKIVDVDVHELEDTNDERNRKNQETTDSSHLAISSRLREEQETSSRMRKENSELKFKLTSMADEIEQLKDLLEQQQQKAAQQIEQSPKSGKKSAFFKRGKKQTSSMSARNVEEGQRFMREQHGGSRRSRSPDIHTNSDSALQRFASHGRTDEKTAASSPKASPHFSRHHRSGSALADVQTLQTCLKLALDDKSALTEQNKQLEEELKDAKNRVEKLQQNSPRIRKTNQEVELLKQTLKASLTEKDSLKEQLVLLEREVENGKAKEETMANELADTLVKKDLKIGQLEQENKKLMQEVSGLKLRVKASTASAKVAAASQSAEPADLKPARATAAVESVNTKPSYKSTATSPPHTSVSKPTTPVSSDRTKPKQADAPQTSSTKPDTSQSAVAKPDSSKPSSHTRERLYTAPCLGSAAKSPPLRDTATTTNSISPGIRENDKSSSGTKSGNTKPVSFAESSASPHQPSSSSSVQAQKPHISEKSKSTPEFSKTESTATPVNTKLFRRNQSRAKVSAARALFEEKIEVNTSPKKTTSPRKVSWTLGGGGGGAGVSASSSEQQPASVNTSVKTHSKSSSFDSAKIMSTVSPPSSGNPRLTSTTTEPVLHTGYHKKNESVGGGKSSTTTSPSRKDPQAASKVSSITVRTSASPQSSPVLSNNRKNAKEVPVHSPTKTVSRDAAKQQTTSGPTSPQKSFSYSSSRSTSFTSQQPQGKEVRMRSNTVTTQPSSTSTHHHQRPGSFTSTTTGGSSSFESKQPVPSPTPAVTKSYSVARFSSVSVQSSSSTVQAQSPAAQPQAKTIISPTSSSPQVSASVRTEKVVIRQIARKLSVPTPSSNITSSSYSHNNDSDRVSPLKDIPERNNKTKDVSESEKKPTPSSQSNGTTRVPLRMNRRPRSERPATMFAGSGADRLASLVVQLQEQERQKNMLNSSSRGSQRPSSMVFPSETEPVSAKNLAWGGGQRRSKKAMLLHWCQYVTTDYQNVGIQNFGGSFSDGMAFCAILHHFIPEKIPFHTLQAENRAKNFKIAFEAAESEGIPSLLDIDDMVALPIPDWMSVMTYVSFIYNKFGQTTSS